MAGKYSTIEIPQRPIFPRHQTVNYDWKFQETPHSAPRIAFATDGWRDSQNHVACWRDLGYATEVCSKHLRINIFGYVLPLLQPKTSAWQIRHAADLYAFPASETEITFLQYVDWVFGRHSYLVLVVWSCRYVPSLKSGHGFIKWMIYRGTVLKPQNISQILLTQKRWHFGWYFLKIIKQHPATGDLFNLPLLRTRLNSLNKLYRCWAMLGYVGYVGFPLICFVPAGRSKLVTPKSPHQCWINMIYNKVHIWQKSSQVC